jgi:hypothetical protein
MPPVEILSRVSELDVRPALTDYVHAATLAHEQDADQRSEGAGWVPGDAEEQSKWFHAQNGGSTTTAPTRSVRRATARRASHRRATARSHQSHTEARIIDFVAQHPGSTVGDLARGLNLDPTCVSVRLARLEHTGEITKASHGYSTKQAARPGTSAHFGAHTDSSQNSPETRTAQHRPLIRADFSSVAEPASHRTASSS